MLRLSVVTPSFNQAPFIEQTIRSVLDQGYPALDYRVLDGGSTDGTLDVLRRYEGRLSYVSGPDGGQAAALNRGFTEAEGDVIGWINSDDYYAPGAFDTVMRVFEEQREVKWLFGRCPIVDKQGVEIRPLVTRYKELAMRHYRFEWLMLENFISQPAVFFRRAFLDEICGGGPALDPSMNHAFDYHLWLRMAERVRPLYLDQVLAYFRVYAEAKTSANYFRNFREEADAARRVADGRHPVLVALHELNYYRLTTAYTVLRAIGR
jgi:glycosyltransferase involved in cell wall biosynthesis